jgi:hypothetical protein
MNITNAAACFVLWPWPSSAEYCNISCILACVSIRSLFFGVAKKCTAAICNAADAVATGVQPGYVEVENGVFSWGNSRAQESATGAQGNSKEKGKGKRGKEKKEKKGSKGKNGKGDNAKNGAAAESGGADKEEETKDEKPALEVRMLCRIGCISDRTLNLSGFRVLSDTLSDPCPSATVWGTLAEIACMRCGEELYACTA